LAKLGQTTDSLTLAQDVAQWMADSAIVAGGNDDIFAEAELCERLGRHVLLKHPNVLELCAPLYAETYLPLYHYVYESLLSLLRQALGDARYPKGCKPLLKECRHATSQFSQICTWLIQLERVHREVLDTIEGQGPPESSLPVVLRELVQPIVERIRFHFVEASKDRATSNRIDRLPEWLLTYLRENVLHDGGPYDLIQLGLARVLEDSSMSVVFLNELVRLVQWVLTERQFFRHPEISGPRSNPLLLYNAVEQFLLFDRTLQEAAPADRHSLLGLMDILITPDEELMKWWMERERESVFSTLFEDDSTANVPKPLANHVSPRAEIFCALIRSVQCKASTLSSPGPYLRAVAVPLCSQFVDALHETSTDLRNLLCQPQSSRGTPPSESQLISNLHEWIEIINGTHLAARVLLREGAWQHGMSSSQSDHDLARFGRSLERLVEVLVEELAASFVETILMERAKLASYLMMASHLLASETWEGDYATDASVELKETRVVLHHFHQVCRSILVVPQEDDQDDDDEPSPDQQIAQFAPLAIRAHVMNRLADKFLEVALDIHNMTPDIWREGANVFARDVRIILAGFEYPLVQRLLEITQLLSMDTNSLQTLLAALGGLVGASTFLDIHDFSSDGTLYEEAVSMIKAKGFKEIELNDVISILNRRRD
jgi:hypothetical protein